MSRKWFRFLILLSWVLGAASITFYFVEERSLPQELKDYVYREANDPVAARHYVMLGYVLFAVILALVNTVGLYRFRPWARTLFLWGFVACYALSPFVLTEAAVMTPLSWVLSSLNTALTGFTLALLYFSSVARYFDRQPSV